ncbi:MAG TPA: trypsin-like peptidase domain-containing protein, partial [Thermoleophilaceae bacterium]|nr:trypsin-like peptidase domain-containing protein [Thermoleophilaceae bacterium]
MTPTDPQPRRGSNFLSGLLGGFVVLAVGGGLIATGVLGEDEGDNPKEPTAAQSITRSVDDSGDAARSVSDIYREEGQGVVFVRSQGVSSSGEGGGESPFGQPDGGSGTATGSGFVVDRQGYVVTNAHVVEGAKKVSVSFDEKTSTFVDAEVKGTDVSSDLAVLKIDPSDVEDMKVLPLGDSSDAKVGAPTIAIGNPFGFTRTVTTGIVSAVQRTIEAPNNFSIADVIQ